MLNKELLLFNLEKDLEFTHVITVGERGNSFGYDGYYPYGSITPKIFDTDLEIKELLTHTSFNRTDFKVDGFLGVTILYIGRTDTRQVVHLPTIDETRGTAAGARTIFSEKDVGKTINLWIGENPPPWA